MDFSEQIIQEMKVDKDAEVVRKLIRELIHNENDVGMLKNIMNEKGIIRTKRVNKLFNCLCDLAKIKNNIHEVANQL